MSRAGRSKRKQAKARKAPIAVRPRSRLHTRPRWMRALEQAWRGVSFVWKVVGGVLLLLGGISTLHFYTTRISITPGATVSERDPFAPSFYLFRKTQYFRFVTGRKADGTFVWTPMADDPIKDSGFKEK
jgi:hypothetical protein